MIARRAAQASATYLFVYGSLMKGFRDAWQPRAGAKFVGEGSIAGRLYDLGSHPGAIPLRAARHERVWGELYRLERAESALKILDRYEEFFPFEPRKSMFVRKSVVVTLQHGSKRQAWVYFYNRRFAGAKLIPGGSYRASLAGRQSSSQVRSEPE